MVALTGFMGSGKTSVGQALGELLGWEFVDLDEEIERQEKMAIRELFRERGEAAFRATEHDTLRSCIEGSCRATVVALGGGAFLQASNAELLRASGVQTVFLEAPVEEMLQRCKVEDATGAENPRPLARDARAFRELYEQRLTGYRNADVTISTAGKAVEEVAREIEERMQLSAER
jgi:shikimate kinase